MFAILIKKNFYNILLFMKVTWKERFDERWKILDTVLKNFAGYNSENDSVRNSIWTLEYQNFL